MAGTSVKRRGVKLPPAPENASHVPGGRVKRVKSVSLDELTRLEQEENELRDELARERKNRKQLLLRVPAAVFSELLKICRTTGRDVGPQAVECLKVGCRLWEPDSTVLGSRPILDFLPEAQGDAVMENGVPRFNVQQVRGRSEMHADPEEMAGSWMGADAGLPVKVRRGINVPPEPEPPPEEAGENRGTFEAFRQAAEVAERDERDDDGVTLEL